MNKKRKRYFRRQHKRNEKKKHQPKVIQNFTFKNFINWPLPSKITAVAFVFSILFFSISIVNSKITSSKAYQLYQEDKERQDLIIQELTEINLQTSNQKLSKDEQINLILKDFNISKEEFQKTLNAIKNHSTDLLELVSAYAAEGNLKEAINILEKGHRKLELSCREISYLHYLYVLNNNLAKTGQLKFEILEKKKCGLDYFFFVSWAKEELLSQKYSSALDKINTAFTFKKQPCSHLLALKAEILEKLNRHDDALKLRRQYSSGKTISCYEIHSAIQSNQLEKAKKLSFIKLQTVNNERCPYDKLSTIYKRQNKLDSCYYYLELGLKNAKSKKAKEQLSSIWARRLNENKKHIESSVLIDSMLRIIPNSSDLHEVKAFLKYNQNKDKEALENIDLAIKFESQKPSSTIFLSQLKAQKIDYLMQFGKMLEAESYGSKVIKENHLNGLAYEYLARVYFINNKKQLSKKTLEDLDFWIKDYVYQLPRYKHLNKK